MNAKKMIIVGTAALMLLVGAGVAYASGSGGDSSAQAKGTNLDKAKSVALEQVNGRVTGSEAGDEEGAYQIEVTRDDGSKVDVNLDKDFNVISTPSDNEGQDGHDASNDGGGCSRQRILSYCKWQKGRGRCPGPSRCLFTGVRGRGFLRS